MLATTTLQSAAVLRRAALLAAMLTTLPGQPALGQTPPMQTCQLGDLTLESGEVIRDFRKEIRDLLSHVAEGRPGISGPRFPRNWNRTDFCPN